MQMVDSQANGQTLGKHAHVHICPSKCESSAFDLLCLLRKVCVFQTQYFQIKVLLVIQQFKYKLGL